MCVRVALCAACFTVYRGGTGAGLCRCVRFYASALLLGFLFGYVLLHFAVVAWLHLCMPRCPDVRMSCMEALAIVVRCFIFYIRFGVCAICYIKSRKIKKIIVKFVQFNGINTHTMLNYSTPKTKIFLDFWGLLWYNLTVRRKEKRTRWQQIRKKHKKSECLPVPKVSTHQQNPRQAAQRATRRTLPPDRSHCNTVREKNQ